MSQQQQTYLMHLRGILIHALNVLDDLLGLPRTVPSRAERRKRAAVADDGLT